VTETRTGPLGCSNYDNLDSVSSVLVQSPENKVQLQGRAGRVGTWRWASATVGCSWRGGTMRRGGCWLDMLLLI